MYKVLRKLFGEKSTRDIKKVLPIVEEINKKFKEYQTLSNDELREKSQELRRDIAGKVAEEKDEIANIREELTSNYDMNIDEREKKYETIESLEDEVSEKMKSVLDTVLPDAFALMKETARRFKENETITVTANDFDKDLAVNTTKEFVSIHGTDAIYETTWDANGSMIKWDMVHYDVQLIGGIVLHQGKIAEMSTGEGKTLVATLPVFLNALSGLGVHLITVNNYLAKRDSEWMGPLFEFHGLKIDCIDKYRSHSKERKEAYLADITYGTNNEFGFDYLRDNMATDIKDQVQRRLNFSIVDEVDSVLIDDARTPLIISGPTENSNSGVYEDIKPQIERLFQVQKNFISKVFNEIKELLKEGKEKEAGLLLLRCSRGLPKYKPFLKLLNEQGIKPLLNKTLNFYMQDRGKEMPTVDEPLLFTIDEKQNSIELTDKGIDLISENLEDKNFFILPDISEKMGAIEKSTLALDEKDSQRRTLLDDYSVKSERVHSIHQMLKAFALFEKDIDYVVMNNKVKIVDEQTGRIMEGRRYSDGLHQALEAKESCKVEESTQTYATVTLQNFFRMYQKLAGMTGTAETEAREFWEIYKLDVVIIPTNRPIMRDDKQDFIYKTKKAKYGAVIKEVIKLVEGGRAVLVGTTSVEVSELLSRLLKQNKIPHNVLNAKLHQKEAEIVAEAGKPGTVTIATNMAGRGTDIKITEEVRAVGGLAIVGTERHDSRRVDRQLRGRSGRQGDPGSSQFFVSMEDDLMRLFNSERLIKIMDYLKMDEDEVIQHSAVTRSIERAQKRVEENNFGIRKRLLEYDNVINKQREVIYKKRQHALTGDKIKIEISDALLQFCETLAEAYSVDGDFQKLQADLIQNFSFSLSESEENIKEMNENALSTFIYEALVTWYKKKMTETSTFCVNILRNLYEKNGKKPGRIALPFFDGIKTLNIVVNIEDIVESDGGKITVELEKAIFLANTDLFWKEHLRELDDLKQNVQNMVYEQKDPLLIFKFESFNLFKEMLDSMTSSVVQFLFKAKFGVSDENASRRVKEVEGGRNEKIKTSRKGESIIKQNRSQATTNKEPEENKTPVKAEEKIPRNAPCPCGSGKKYKQCCGKRVAV